MLDDNVFHAHLEHCKQCHDDPMNLCSLGGRLLELQVKRGSAGMSLSLGLVGTRATQDFGLSGAVQFDENRDPLMILHKQVGAKELIAIDKQLNPQLYRGDMISQIAETPEEEKMMRSMRDIPGPIGEFFRAFAML